VQHFRFEAPDDAVPRDRRRIRLLQSRIHAGWKRLLPILGEKRRFEIEDAEKLRLLRRREESRSLRLREVRRSFRCERNRTGGDARQDVEPRGGDLFFDAVDRGDERKLARRNAAAFAAKVLRKRRLSGVETDEPRWRRLHVLESGESEE